jgi:hypothetical protein
MNIIESIERYKELDRKNKQKGGLIPKEADESYKLQTYIEEHIIDAIKDGYILVRDNND